MSALGSIFSAINLLTIRYILHLTMLTQSSTLSSYIRYMCTSSLMHTAIYTLCSIYCISHTPSPLALAPALYSCMHTPHSILPLYIHSHYTFIHPTLASHTTFEFTLHVHLLFTGACFSRSAAVNGLITIEGPRRVLINF